MSASGECSVALRKVPKTAATAIRRVQFSVLRLGRAPGGRSQATGDMTCLAHELM